jgi:hypothetical protein
MKAGAPAGVDADVITYLMVMALIGLVILIPAAGELGKRMKTDAGEEGASAAAA